MGHCNIERRCYRFLSMYSNDFFSFFCVGQLNRLGLSSSLSSTSSFAPPRPPPPLWIGIFLYFMSLLSVEMIWKCGRSSLSWVNSGASLYEYFDCAEILLLVSLTNRRCHRRCGYWALNADLMNHLGVVRWQFGWKIPDISTEFRLICRSPPPWAPTREREGEVLLP